MTILYFLLTFILGSALYAAFSRDSSALFISGALCLVAALFIFNSGVDVHTGHDINKTQIDSNTTEIVKEKTYTDLEEKSGIDIIDASLLIVFLAAGLYFLIAAASARVSKGG